ncbi:conserved hypothetical protein [Leishmania braziliensis MHOM/BR/75/M2904]|uniref:Uncharacterized protein n=2 Tax=Leishmania braziliensis TaxID=5660 RepID=A4HEB3_LEIBR|nr:conserved hypothetical protein [Leishmania braziliensis MHOM/BR/75/M2904]KAI5690384.1 Tetratricopeptide repeat [Leishmania braziliensis]CAJ2474388.1 unnamed protein product [Leishmania braziliensis]CAJ2474895.1 unnamed protein product [Leishmania braziliensis]CAM39166.1 conserved hypothetical protein [Leishmania braziliensis MHOM/BR/75/M2904]SYZ66627.1 Tetratricopeptide_repeat/TPR_repeat [Leishmania braziliensis MHOM/BR/75/M2904]
MRVRAGVCAVRPSHARHFLFLLKYACMSEEVAFKRAGALFIEGKYPEAISAYTAIETVNEATVEVRARALNNISACYAALKNYEMSSKVAREVIVLQPNNAKAHGRIAAAEEGLKRYDEAAFYYSAASRLEANNPVYVAGAQRCHALVQASRGVASAEAKDAYYYKKSLERAMKAMQEANYLEAIRHFGKALDLFPTTGTSREKAALLCNRSAAYFRAERIEESADDALEAIKADDKYARGFYRLGAAKTKLKKVGDAYDALTTCLKLDPNNADAGKLLAEVLPAALESRKTAEERARDHTRQVTHIAEQLNAMQATASANTAPQATAHGSAYSYCNFCNETGHSRSECSLLRRKRSRPL